VTTEYTEIKIDAAFSEGISLAVKLAERLASQETAKLEHGEIEKLVESDGKKVLCQLLQDHLDLRKLREERRESVGGVDDVNRNHIRERTRKLGTTLGEVNVGRLAYSTRGADSLMPLDAELNMPPDRYSHGLRRRMAEEVARGSFDEAVEAVGNTTGGKVPKRQAEELAAKAAEHFDEFYEGRKTDGPEKTDDLLVLTEDGKGVVMRKKDLRAETRKAAERKQRLQQNRKGKKQKKEKESRKRVAMVAAVYTVAPNVREPEEVIANLWRDEKDAERRPRPRPENKRVWASVKKGVDVVMDDLFLEALRRDPDKVRTWAMLVDGDPRQLERIRDFAELHEVKITVVLDFIHVLGYLWKAAHCFFPKDSVEADEWTRERALRILLGKSSDVAAGMRRSATKLGMFAAKRKGVDKCAGYLLNNREYLYYDKYLALGLPIATGVIEGACRYLVKDRMELTGARWGLAGAETVLKLRALKASGDFEEYWDFHRTQEYKRNHRSRYAETPWREAA
jgi:hypothetical protein